MLWRARTLGLATVLFSFSIACSKRPAELPVVDVATTPDASHLEPSAGDVREREVPRAGEPAFEVRELEDSPDAAAPVRDARPCIEAIATIRESRACATDADCKSYAPKAAKACAPFGVGPSCQDKLPLDARSRVLRCSIRWCDLPYLVDPTGRKRYKAECL